MLLLQKQCKKEIDTAPISHLYSVGECHPEPVEIVLERFAGNADLSEWQFQIRGVNAAHEPVYQELQIHGVHENTICLRWNVERTFTAFAGVLHLELHALSPETENAACMHYPMGDIWISPSVWGTGMPLIRRMQDVYCQMQGLYQEMTVLSLHLPQISEETGTWLVYDAATGAYTDTGIQAAGVPGENGADGNDGQDGASAYEIAVNHGFQGTESEWLVSLKGEKGDPGEPGVNGTDGVPGVDGKDGAPGTDGQDGASAYEVWLNAGNTGTEVDFLSSLKGEKGDTGEQGAPGVDGQNGTDGADGQDGQDGASAYEIWLNAGNTGTEADFLASLKGQDGAPGANGEDGADGQNGAPGVDGKDGADGFSPTAVVTKSGSVVTITITDVNGTTTASMTEGADVDLTPYATIVYVDEQIQGLENTLGGIQTALAAIVEVAE